MKCIIRRRLFFYICIIIFLDTVLIGCGKKGPPVPPRRFIPPAVNDLSYQMAGSTLSLNWTLPAIKKDKTVDIAGCIVFRARTPVSESDCPTCPPKFESVADMSLGGDSQTKKNLKTMNYSEALTHGYRYTYKVNCYSAKGVSGRDSNTVEFNY
jgi:hypothetical protein